MKRDPLQCTRIAAFRAAGDGGGDGRRLRGYAAVFNEDTEIDSWEGHFTERIDPGAFKKTLRESKPIMQWNHGMDPAVGQIPIGVYERLEPDGHGLDVEGPFHTDPVSERVREAIASGAVTGMSFKFQVIRDEWRDSAGKIIRDKNKLYNLLYNQSEDSADLPSRLIKEVRLFEAGPVSAPAYSGTSVGVRSAAEYEDSVRAADLTDDERHMVVARMMRDDDDDAQAAFRAADREADIAVWLREEALWKVNCAKWVEAEQKWRSDCAAWLEAETRYKTSESDAATRSTSGSEKKTDAAPAGTSVHTQQDSTRKVNPMNLEELKARRVAITARLSELGTLHRDAELPETEQAEWDTLDTELRGVEDKIKTIEARTARMADLAATPGHVERSTASAAFHKERDIHDVAAIRMDSNSPEEFADNLRENALRFIEKARVPRTYKADAARERMAELVEDYDDEDGTLAKRFLITGAPAYERAFGKAMKACSTSGLTAEEQRSLVLGTGASGGFAVPVQLDPTVILTSAGVIGDIRSVARVETITGKQWQGVTSAGVTVSRDAELLEVSDDSPTLTQPVVDAKRVAGFVPFSYELDQDWAGLRSEITRMLNDAKRREESTAFALGDGTGANPYGVLDPTTGAQTVAMPTGTTTFAGFKTNILAALYDLETQLDARWRENATFMANKTVYNVIRQADSTAGGNGLWERIGAKLPSQLLGYPIIENSAMSSGVYTNGTRMIAFGDFSQFLIVDRIGMNVELVPQLFGASGRPTGQRGIYALWRNGSKLLVPAAVKVLVTTT